MKITVYGSSSKGNCSLVRFDNGVSAFLDAGIPTKQIKDKKTGKYVFVTHSHKDHSRYAKEFVEKYGGKIVLSQGTKDCLELPDENCAVMTVLEELEPRVALKCVRDARKNANDFCAVAIKTYHDDKEPCAFAIFAGSETLLYLMDTGRIPNTHRMIFDCIFVEANHTPERLAKSLKSEDTAGTIAGRVNSGFGHVGTQDVYDAFQSVLKYNPVILLGHRSATNFDEKEFYQMPDEFVSRCTLVESGKTYNTNPF